MSRPEQTSSKAAPAANLASEVDILKTRQAAKRSLGVTTQQTETIWPKPEWVDNVTTEGKAADGFIIPAGAMFPLGAAIPNHTVMQHGMYFPPGTMPIQTFKAFNSPPEAVCSIM